MTLKGMHAILMRCPEFKRIFELKKPDLSNAVAPALPNGVQFVLKDIFIGHLC